MERSRWFVVVLHSVSSSRYYYREVYGKVSDVLHYWDRFSLCIDSPIFRVFAVFKKYDSRRVLSSQLLRLKKMVKEGSLFI